tara:strand:+ start:347 stop:1936 length:1590 start_codon:yes stop_codon:yes gene_type:complete
MVNVNEKDVILPHQKYFKNFKTNFNSVEDLFISKLKKQKNKKFIFFPEENLEFTYNEFFNSYIKISNILIKKGFKKKDKISIIFFNESAFLKIYFAALSLGMIVIPINPDLSYDEINYIVKNSSSKTCIYSEKIGFKIKKNNKKYFSYSSFFNEEKNKTFINQKNIKPSIKITDEAIIIYTSGTTGNPKGVVLTHQNIISDAFAISKNFKFNSNTRTLCILPMFHNNGQIITFFAPLYASGSTVISTGKANLYNFWNYIKKFNITWTSIMASILSILLIMKKEKQNSSLKGIICGGQILNDEVRRNFEKRFKVSVFEGYGLTETTAYACLNKYPKKNRVIGSIGKALPVNEMAIFNPNNFSKMRVGEEGEICIRGHNVAKYYHNLKNQNKKSFFKGWFRSGDYGKVDSKGNFYFSGRKDSLIIKGGENIYPAEIENALYKIKGVQECAVIGTPDKNLGENICAFIKTENKKASSSDYYDKLKKYLGNYKLPKEIYLVSNLKGLNEIPKGPTKKILYRKLRDYYEKNLKC